MFIIRRDIRVEDNIYKELCGLTKEDNVKVKEPMKLHTTFRIGGEADYFVTPESVSEIKEIVGFCKEKKVPYFVCGNGSNLLVSDAGYKGVVIQIGNKLSHSERENTQGHFVRVQAGAMLTAVANKIRKAGYTGMEFAVGIPGTIGGAVAMNAGAYGGEMKDVIVNALVLTNEGELKTLTREELQLGYRSSVVLKKGYVVLEAVFELTPGNPEEIKALCDKNTRARIEKQPLEYPSAGSTFKRPEGYFAGKLIMDAGLRGYCIGDAQVSEKHCGFLINKKDATATQMLELIHHVQKTVKEKYGVLLETEVKLLGFDKEEVLCD